jgi:hypothetical protein
VKGRGNVRARRGATDDELWSTGGPPPLVVIVTLLAGDPKVMGEQVSPPLLRWLGWATAVAMTAATEYSSLITFSKGLLNPVEIIHGAFHNRHGNHFRNSIRMQTEDLLFQFSECLS